MVTKAHCDLETGKISGCKKGTWLWYHEKGHLVFNSSTKTSFLILVQSYCFDLWMLGIMLSIAYKWFIGITGLIWSCYIGITLYEEYWCNQYAYKQTGGKR